jgi:hypothetical protein
VALTSLARHQKVRVQTVARSPTRQQVELWCKARKLIREGGEAGENEEDQAWLNSMGSELTCSLPSSPDTPQTGSRQLPSGDILV